MLHPFGTKYKILVDYNQGFYMTSELRKQQLREAQQRRRAKLAKGERSQVSLYFDRNNLELMDTWCTQFRLDRNDFINNLISGLSKSPEAIPAFIIPC